MRKILVIDDQPDNLITMKAVIKLHLKNCEVITASSGFEGVRIAEDYLPDTILLDIIMPEMDGFETCKHLRSNPTTRHIPVIMITAIKTDVKTKVKALESGADAFLTKPIDQTELTAQLRVTLRVKEAEDKLRKEQEGLKKTIHKKEEELDLSEEKYKLLYKHAGVSIAYYNLSGNVISVNERASEYFGGRPEDFHGKSLEELFSEQDAKNYRERIKKVAGSCSFESFEEEIKLSGKTIWFQSTFACVKDERGKVMGVQVISHDISGHKKNEKLIKESEEKYRTTLNDLLVGVIVYGKEGDVQLCNPEAERIMGVDKINTNISGSHCPVWKLIQENMENLPEKEYPKIKALEEGIYIKNQVYGVRQDENDLKWVIVNSSPILNDCGNPEKLVINFIDITKRIKSQQIQSVFYEISKISGLNYSLYEFLEKVHFLLNAILEVRNIFIALYDKENDNYSFPYFVDETEEMELNKPLPLKGSLTDLVRQGGKGQIITRESDSVDEIQIKVLGSPSKVWMGAPLANSVTKSIIGVLAVQDYHNEDAYSKDDLAVLELIAYNIGVFIERIQSNAELVYAKDKAEESDRLKSSFLANMSHEIRTPLNGIIGFTSLLQDESLSSEDRKQYNQVIRKSGQRLMDTVDSLIDISKIEAGQVEVNAMDASLNELMDDLFFFFHPEAESKGITLMMHKPFINGEDIIHTDKEKLYAILSNLIKNAIKYTARGRIIYKYRSENNELIFSVDDTGIGIPEHKKEAVFNRFEQVDVNDSRTYEGSGLGLSISKGYVELLGGRIWVESVEGKGATFYFSLPFNTSCGSGTLLHRQSNHLDTGIFEQTILIAEDDPSGSLYLEKLLDEKCTRLLFASNGREAIQLCRQNEDINLVLMDIRMPEMNGLEATREIRKFNKDIRIIAQTAFAMEGDKDKILSAGCDDYISKPVQEEKLLEVIRRNL